jgi:hypothetical protein
VPPRRPTSSNVSRIESPGRALAQDGNGVETEAVAEAVEQVALPAPPVEVEPPAPSREPRHVRAVPTNADLKMARSLDVFNMSVHPRRIVGVARSLGVPMVSVLPSETEGAIVSIVVGWELCWYRYEVDLTDEAAGVRVIAQGAELSELTLAEQVPNAVADDRGRLVLAA